MERQLIKSYKVLILPYSATEEEVTRRKTALIRILNSQNKKNAEKRISKIKDAADMIIDHIKNNGIPDKEHHLFESSNESIIGLFIVFVFVAFICFFCIYIYS